MPVFAGLNFNHYDNYLDCAGKYAIFNSHCKHLINVIFSMYQIVRPVEFFSREEGQTSRLADRIFENIRFRKHLFQGIKKRLDELLPFLNKKIRHLVAAYLLLAK